MGRPDAASAVTVHLGYWLRYVSNHVSHAFARKVEAHGVTVAEWVLLRQLFDDETTTPSGIAARMGATRGTISKLVDRLTGKGLLTRSRSREGNGRGQSLALTAAGRALVPKLAKLADENDAEFFGHLPAKTRTNLQRLMIDLVAHHRWGRTPVD